MDICCIIVTYNRLQLLKESINSVLMYKDKIKKIIVVNNASTDGTTEYLDNICNSENKLVHVKLEKNIGGSGGFYEGIKKSFEYNCDWVWIMDDDTIVKKGSLENLIKPIEEVDNVGFVCSKVVWNDGNIHYMNIPQIKPIVKGIPFNRYENYLVIDSCSFVSVLINTKAIRKVGLPYKEFFIWSDDTEYTQRISNNGYIGLYSNKSLVEHRTGTNYNVDIHKDTKNNYWKYSYGIRNGLFIEKTNNKLKYGYKLMYNLFYLAPKILFGNQENSKELSKIIVKATLKSINFNPKIDNIV